MATVYQATNLINGKRYIGVTSGTLKARIKKHFYDAEHRTKKAKFANALNKHGKDAFRFSVLLTCDSYDDVLRHEARLIALFKPAYNTTKGGRGAVGLKHSEASKKKMSESLMGKPGHWKGKTLPSHVADSIRSRMRTPEGRGLILSVRHMGVAARMRRVVCLNDGEIFESAVAAEKKCGVAASSILKICRKTYSNRSATKGGLVFRFECDTDGRNDNPADIVAAARASQIGARWRHRR